MSMIATALQSGSNGNCIYVETASVRLLFDAGLSGVQTEERLAACGRDIRGIDAVIISHDHSDHVGHAGVLHRKYGLPVYMAAATFAAANARRPLGKMQDVRHFRSCDRLRFGDVQVHAIPTPHDAADGSVFIVEADGRRLGIMTDLGHVFKDLISLVASLDAVFLESNYDPDLLAHGPYPAWLKQRIRGPHGHISNEESADVLARALKGGRLQWACLAHLSEHNNSPETALKTHRAQLSVDFALHVADRSRASDVFTVA
jgi:phosphoribosyl 1,2-cyclic phosphodiesterase